MPCHGQGWWQALGWVSLRAFGRTTASVRFVLQSALSGEGGGATTHCIFMLLSRGAGSSRA